MMNTLFLRLEGPLQSWGVRSRWGERDTTVAPTKSGVVGLVGCALGLRRDDGYLRVLSAGLGFGVRIDRPGTILRDYHTTGGGQFGGAVHRGGSLFHDDPYVGGVLSPEVVKGRIKVKVNATTKEPETDVSERFYLADAAFLVALQGDPAMVAVCAAAVQAPMWPYFLGRKSCVPAAPLFVGVGQYDDLALALGSQPLHARGEQVPRLLIETRLGQGYHQNDAIDVPARRVFAPRAFIERAWSSVPIIDTLEG